MASVDILFKRLLAEHEDCQRGMTSQSPGAEEVNSIGAAPLMTQQQRQQPSQQRQKQEALHKTKTSRGSRDTDVSSTTCQVAVHLLLDLLPDCVLRLGASPARQRAQQASPKCLRGLLKRFVQPVVL